MFFDIKQLFQFNDWVIKYPALVTNIKRKSDDPGEDYNMPKNDKMKFRIYELQSLLNNLVLSGNLQDQNILNISEELDILIIEYYKDNPKG